MYMGIIILDDFHGGEYFYNKASASLLWPDSDFVQGHFTRTASDNNPARK